MILVADIGLKMQNTGKVILEDLTTEQIEWLETKCPLFLESFARDLECLRRYIKTFQENLMIPKMTHPLGKAWSQPSRDKILVCKDHVVMSSKTLSELLDYTRSMPSGVYEGKMWKVGTDAGHWLLCWYGLSDKPDSCSTNHRRIELDEKF